VSARPSGAAGRVARHGAVRRLHETRVLAAILCAIWGSIFVVQRLALQVAPAVWVAAGRALVAALVLLPLAGRLRALSRRGLALAGVLGITNQFAFIGLQVAGLQSVGAGPAAAIIYVQPVLVVLASAPFLGERLTAQRLAAALLGFAGVAVVGLHQAEAASAGGVLLLLGAAVSWAIGALLTSASDEPIVPLVVGQHLVGAGPLLATAALAQPFPALSARLVLCVLCAGVCGSALAWTLWSALLRRGEAGVVSTWLFAVPVLAAVLGVILLGEPMGIELIIGVALVAIAVRLVAAPAGARRASPTGRVR
jgi:drug/metabolite transporter (DMT)-like permease